MDNNTIRDSCTEKGEEIFCTAFTPEELDEMDMVHKIIEEKYEDQVILTWRKLT